jgi:hypothetical protein
VELQPLLENLTQAPILFFFLGIIAALLHSDLEIPQPIPKLLSLFLLIAIGLKGGNELRGHPFTGGELVPTLFSGLFLALLLPLVCYRLVKVHFSRPTAAAIAATYGSTSAVTFITATALLDRYQIPYSGYMVAIMALMEFPAIIIGLSLAGTRDAIQPSETIREQGGRLLFRRTRHLLRNTLCHGSILLLLGSLCIGMIASPHQYAKISPLFNDLFYGILTIFLLDMGLLVGRRWGEMDRERNKILLWGLLLPIINGLISILVARVACSDLGDALLLVVLGCSGSYIAVPAAMRLALPEARATTYITMALAVTFPFNILVGLPAYYKIMQALWNQ